MIERVAFVVVIGGIIIGAFWLAAGYAAHRRFFARRPDEHEDAGV